MSDEAEAISEALANIREIDVMGRGIAAFPASDILTLRRAAEAHLATLPPPMREVEIAVWATLNDQGEVVSCNFTDPYATHSGWQLVKLTGKATVPA